MHLKQTIIDESGGTISRGAATVLERIEENLKVYNGAARAMNGGAVPQRRGAGGEPESLEDLCTAVRTAGRDAGHVCLEVQGSPRLLHRDGGEVHPLGSRGRAQPLIYGGDEETQSSTNPPDSGSEDEDEASRPKPRLRIDEQLSPNPKPCCWLFFASSCFFWCGCA